MVDLSGRSVQLVALVLPGAWTAIDVERQKVLVVGTGHLASTVLGRGIPLDYVSFMSLPPARACAIDCQYLRFEIVKAISTLSDPISLLGRIMKSV